MASKNCKIYTSESESSDEEIVSSTESLSDSNTESSSETDSRSEDEISEGLNSDADKVTDLAAEFGDEIIANKEDNTITPEENKEVNLDDEKIIFINQSGNDQHPVYYYSKKSMALKALDILLRNNSALKLFQEDIQIGTGAKRFVIMTTETAYILSRKSHDEGQPHSYYESYESDTLVKLFLDIDMPFSKIKIPEGKTGDMFLNHIIDNVINIIRKYINKIYPNIITKVSNESIIILKASSEKKLSAHVIFTQIGFINAGVLKGFMQCIKESVTAEEMTEFFESADNKHVDFGVYNSGRCFRMMWNTKIGVNTPLEYGAYNDYYKITKPKIFFTQSMITCLEQDVVVIKDIITPQEKAIYKGQLVEQQRKNPTRKPIPRQQIGENNKDKYLFDAVSIISTLLNMVNLDRADDYNDWLEMMIIVKNCNPFIESFKVFNKWSKQSSNYNSSGFTLKKWMTINIGQKTIGSLHAIAKKDDPIAYDEWAYNRDPLLYVIKPPDSVCNIDTKYLMDKYEHIYDKTSDFTKAVMSWVPETLIKSESKTYDKNDASAELKFIIKYKYLAIKSAYDTGKTTMIKKLLSEFSNHFSRVLFITYRQSLSLDFLGNFEGLGFKCYLNNTQYDKNKPNEEVYDAYKSKRAIVQIESLPHFRDGSGTIPKFDLVIFDEPESGLNHFSSPTIINKKDVFTFMTNIILNATSVLMLDGDFGNRAYYYMTHLAAQQEAKFRMIINARKKCIKSFILTPYEAQFHEQIRLATNANKKFIVVSQSSEYAQALANNLDKIPSYTKKVLCHTSKTNDELKNKLVNVNKLWVEYDIVLYSPTITAGVNFDTVHFDTMFVVLSQGSNNPRDLMQMLSRCRKFNDIENNILKVWIYTNSIPIRETTMFHKFEQVFEYNTYLNKTFKQNAETITDKDGQKRETYDTLYNNICTFNEQERLNSLPENFMPYLLSLFREKGHMYKFADKPIAPLEKIDIKTSTKDILCNTPDITDEQADALLKKQRNRTATTEEKYKVDRFMLKKILCVENLTGELINKYYRKIDTFYSAKLFFGADELFQQNKIDFTPRPNQDKTEFNQDMLVLKRHMRVHIFKEVLDVMKIDTKCADFTTTIFEFNADVFRNDLRNIKAKTRFLSPLGFSSFDDVSFGKTNLRKLAKSITDDSFSVKTASKVFSALFPKFGLIFGHRSSSKRVKGKHISAKIYRIEIDDAVIPLLF